jgi:Wzt C-terminal domain
MEVGAELRESGTGELRIAGLAVEGADGVARDRFIAGESISIRTLLEADVGVPTARLSLELRDLTGALLGASHSDLAELGWHGSPGMGEIRFSVDRLPLAEGTFQIGVTLVDADGSRRYHRVDRAAQFVVSGTDSVRGPLLLEGEWTLAGAQRNVGAA